MSMTEKTKQIMAKRLGDLMDKHPSLNTLEKIKKKAKVGFGTVRRVRNAEYTDVQIGNVERIAACFELTLAEFVSEPADVPTLSDLERRMLVDLRTLDPEDALACIRNISRMAQMKKAITTATATQNEESAVRPLASKSHDAQSGRQK
jgi:hypothetical protein